MIFSLASLALSLGVAAAATDVMVNVHPETIQIGANYNGEQVSVTGKVAADTQVVIRVKGKTKDYKLKEKGRALGVLWMNLGSVEISNVPDLFLLFLPETKDQSAHNGDGTWRALDLGLEGLRKKATIETEDQNTDGLFEEFVKLKQKSGLYGTIDNAVQYGPNEGEMKSFKASLALPAALPQGKFDIEVFAIKDGAVEASTIHSIEAKEVGMPAWIAKMAFQHGTLYGVLAVAAAVLAGLLTGVMFKGEKGAH